MHHEKTNSSTDWRDLRKVGVGTLELTIQAGHFVGRVVTAQLWWVGGEQLVLGSNDSLFWESGIVNYPMRPRCSMKSTIFFFLHRCIYSPRVHATLNFSFRFTIYSFYSNPLDPWLTASVVVAAPAAAALTATSVVAAAAPAPVVVAVATTAAAAILTTVVSAVKKNERRRGRKIHHPDWRQHSTLSKVASA